MQPFLLDTLCFLFDMLRIPLDMSHFPLDVFHFHSNMSPVPLDILLSQLDV